MFILQVFTDDGILMLLDAQVEVTPRVAYKIRITRITLKFIHNALLVYKYGLCFRNFQIFRDFPTCENWLYFSLFGFFFLIVLCINASFIVMYFLTYYFLYNGHYLVIICISVVMVTCRR